MEMTQLSDLPLIGGEAAGPPGETRKILPPSAENDPKFQDLKKFFIDWINEELKYEHIVVKSLEDDLFDGLVLHHLFEKISGDKVDVEEMTLSAVKQRAKLGVLLGAVSQHLGAAEEPEKWDVNLIFAKDLLATLHLLVALAQRFRPDLALPADVCVDVVIVEPTKTGMKTEKATEFITGSRDRDASSKTDAFDQLFDLNPDKVKDVKQAIVNFVNKHLASLCLTVTDLDSQFADGVILLLLIGQLEGYFINLSCFFLTPTTHEEKIHNVSLALELLVDGGVLHLPINPADVVSGDIKTTLRVLYSLFLKHKRS